MALYSGEKMEHLVKVKDYIPDIWVDLKYASEDNFTGHKIYDFTEAYLRYGTVQKLMKVQEALRKQGLSLKIWACPLKQRGAGVFFPCLIRQWILSTP